MGLSTEILTKIFERTPLVYLVVGGALVVTGATGGWPTIHLAVDSQPWRIVLAVLGLVLAGVAIYLALRESIPSIDCKAYDISISSPQNNETLNPPITISGRCKQLPKGVELWLFTISSGTGEYWPQDSSEIREETWSVKANPGQFKPGDRRKYGVFLVGPNGKVLIRYFKTVGRGLSQGQGWPGIRELTSDIVQCGPTRDVILK
jgi:hypothetical protein